MLISYLIIPFVFAFLIGINSFIKNPIYIRRFAKTLSFIQFTYACATFFLANTSEFSFLNINFIYDKNAQFLLFLGNLIFFLFSIFSKTFIAKLHKVFYATSFLLLGLISFAILSNSILVFFLSLFWIFLVNYFLFILFSKKEDSKQVKYQLASDLIFFFIATSLILFDFARYFIINDIDFTFLNLSENLYKIDDFSINYTFWGMLIVIARLFNFIPFNAKNLSLANKINPIVFCFNSTMLLILGCSLFLKTYLNFDYLLFEFQDIIGIFLVINFAIFVILTLRQKNIFKYLTNIFCATSIIVFFSIFSFEQECINTFLYSIFVFCLSYSLSAFVLMVLKDKFKTDNLDDFKKIEDKTKLSQLFLTFSFLNMASIPLLPIFGFELICFMMIFSTEYEGVVLNIMPYCLIFGVLILSLASFGILYKILIEPVQKTHTQIAFSNHQIVACTILIFALILLGVYPEFLFKQMSLPIELGQF